MSRLGSPDTQADEELKSALNANSLQNFVMVAGAGSGKTTSLVKALDHIIRSCRERLTIEGRRVACITYTEIAAEEIARDVGTPDLVHVSTIHSFLWSIVHPFASDIARWVEHNLKERIEDERARLSAPGTRQASRAGIESELARLNEHLNEVRNIRRWTYGTGSDYKQGVLGHSDILRMVPALIIEKPKLAKVVAQRFPYILVDESQDTDPMFVKALKRIAQSFPSSFCLGFFGDPMQQIYTTGIGRIDLEPGWKEIKKPENYRCSRKVLSVVNAVRRNGDGLVQVPGSADQILGSSRMYVLPSDDKRGERLERLRVELAAQSGGSKWQGSDDGLRVLVIVHRMAARRLGFEALYEAAHDKAPDSIKQPFAEGDLWILGPLRDYLLPLMGAHLNGQSYAVMSLLRRYSPLLRRDSITTSNVKEVLLGLRRAVDQLVVHFSNESTTAIVDVLRFAVSSGLLALDDRLSGFLNEPKAEGAQTDEMPQDKGIAISRILACPAVQVRAYSKYIEGESPYATQHGIKGTEFSRVMVILDDDEGRYNLYSYDKLFNLRPLSKADSANIEEGKDSILDRTRRLFYVCCSRAREDLVVVLYSQQPDRAIAAIRQSAIFPPEDVSMFDAV